MAAIEQYTLPLFPLNAVIFPGSRLPLHIYEERYKTLVNEAVAGNTSFGINLIYENKIRSIGCTVIVAAVTTVNEDGTMEIVVEGLRRYTLHGMTESDRPYHIGTISFYDDTEEHLDPSLVDAAAELYNRFVALAFKGTVHSLASFSETQLLSFVMVQKAGLELVQRQLFLTMQSENMRLKYLIRHFELMLPLLNDKNRIDTIIINDGYVPIT
jgi:Lon protease-like protein